MIQNETPRTADYVGDGTQTSFPYPFLIFAADDLAVYQAGVRLIRNTHYVVTGVGQDQGGTVVLGTPLPVGVALAIRSDVPAVQPTHFQEGSSFPAAIVERALDRVVALYQQAVDSAARSLRLSPATPQTADLTLPTPVPIKLIGWNSAGTAMQNYDLQPQGPKGDKGDPGAQGIPGTPGAGASPTVREVDGVPAIDAVTAIEFDQADGFVVSNQGGAIARINLPAGATGTALRAAATAAAARSILATPGLAADNTVTGRQQGGQGVALASAATLTPGLDGNAFHVTGTATITAIGDLAAGTRLLLTFDSTPTLVHSSNLLLQGGVNYTAAAGDTSEFKAEGGGVWREVNRHGVRSTTAFTSSPQAITLNAILTVAHGLGSLPTLVRVVLRNATGELGYSPGDEIDAGSVLSESFGQGVNVAADATNVTVPVGSTLHVYHKSTPATTVAITTGNWRWVVRAWVL